MSMIPSFFNNRRSSNFFDPFPLGAWDPFRDLTSLSSSSLSRDTSAIVNARVDWRETPEAHVFKADLPGLKKEEVKVEIEEDNTVLKISGERHVEKEDKNDTWHSVERSSGQFSRRFRLPDLEDKAQASFHTLIVCSQISFPRSSPTKGINSLGKTFVSLYHQSWCQNIPEDSLLNSTLLALMRKNPSGVIGL